MDGYEKELLLLTTDISMDNLNPQAKELAIYLLSIVLAGGVAEEIDTVRIAIEDFNNDWGKNPKNPANFDKSFQT